jgi:hypothetical protein
MFKKAAKRFNSSLSKSVKPKDAIEPPKPSNPRENIEIPYWNPQKLEVSKFKTFQLNQVSKNLKRHFELTNANALLNRQITTNLINQPKDKIICLSGRKGVGKSSLLFQAANHFKETGIVIYLKLSKWINGTFPFESRGDFYYQFDLSRAVLLDVLEMNPEFKDLKYDEKRSLKDYILEKTRNKRECQEAFEAVLKYLVALERPVTFALDQANALFCKTQYCDKESNPLTSNRFQMVQSIYRLLNNPIPKNTFIVLANDSSETWIKSFYFERLMKEASQLNIDPLTFNTARYKELKPTKFDVILPDKMDKSKYDLFPKNLSELSNLKENVATLTVPVFNFEEVESIMNLYKSNRLYDQGKMMIN